MIRTTSLRARFVVLALLVFAFFSFLLLGPYKVTPGHLSPSQPTDAQQWNSGGAVLTGHAIAPRLGNATAKYVPRVFTKHESRVTNRNLTNCCGRAELGRAAWKVLHTTFARFPEKPSEEEQEALRSYVHLFQRLYPWYVAPQRRYAAEVRRKLTWPQWRVRRAFRTSARQVPASSIVTKSGSNVGLLRTQYCQ
jgi:hypothetical protein